MYLKYPDKAAQFSDEVRAFVRAHLPAEISDKVKKRQKISPDEQRLWQRTLCDRGWACPGWPKQHGGPGFDQAETDEDAQKDATRMFPVHGESATLDVLMSASAAGSS